MFITHLTIQAESGQQVEVRRTEAGALVSCEAFAIELPRDADREDAFGVALHAAGVLYGTDPRRGGRVRATNSMVHDVLNEIERVAGR